MMPASARPSAFIQIRPKGFDYPCACGARVFNTPQGCRCSMTDEIRRETCALMRPDIAYWRNIALGWSVAAWVGFLLLLGIGLGVWLR